MTQPSLYKTFDTSLIDVQKSFSSTETNTSGSTGKENMPPSEEQSDQPPRHGSPFKEVPTEQLYEQWASTYDTDGNILQFVDDLQMVDLLKDFVRVTTRRNDHSRPDLRILDLGCGTGRNTLKLLQAPWTDVDAVTVSGWDSSPAMLEVAKSKCKNAAKGAQSNVPVAPVFDVVDIANPGKQIDHFRNNFDGLISTLVLEHIKLEAFFDIVAKVLKPGAYALVTGMHQDLGRLSSAGYKTSTGERFKSTSYAYTPEETVAAAAAVGLQLVGGVDEKAVEQEMIDGGVLENGVRVEKGAVAERARKWIGTTIWVGMMFRKT
jgi:SAM-dependent methyltransferase